MKSPSDPSYGRTWGWSFVAGSAAHVLLIGALFLRPSPPVERTADLPAIAIEMAEMAAPPAPVHDTPTPRQIEAPVPKPQPKRDPQPKKLPFVSPPLAEVEPEKPEVVVQAKEEEVPAPVVNQPLPPAPTTTELAAPDLKPADKSTALLVNGAAAGKATPEELWDARVLARVEMTKRYPRAAAQSGQQDDVDVLLTMDRDGNLLDAKIRRSQGFALLDEAALDAVRRATPFPKPPKEIEGDNIRLSVIVRFFKKA